ncbi:TetR/AcrR family transcriptional regulator [Alicyclobacillus tolerans]|uniref:TetR/AcrR family transcriptional regulator n=1 Tax=Alicyclobacillus tolerans TaxID=90970 RepID=UPI001F2A8AA3|nr:TetR/AcrR family transcriptional regulator [Alicyclobacillus tolerans]MCF8568079.1 TetR/AcrR family transcriptional regulator [Alicyclobacillus tolerans]
MNESKSKQEIYEVAEKLFSKKGYHGTTIREIAQARGILSGSLYSHISSKEDLLFQIVDDGAEAFLGALEPIVRSSEDAKSKLRQGLAAHIGVVTTQMDAAKVFLHEWTALSEFRREIIQDKRDRYENLWAELISEGISEGVLRDQDPKYLRILILSIGNWVYEWYKTTGDLNPEQLADRFMDIILNGAAFK